jgi:replicative DNA helicase
MNNQSQVVKNQSLTTQIGSNHEKLHNDDMEKAIIAAIMASGDLYKKAKKLIPSSRLFWGEKNKTVYDAFEKLDREGLDIDLVTVSEKLKDSFVSVGDLASYVSNIPGEMHLDVTLGHIESYCKIVAELYAKRIVYEAVAQGQSVKDAIKTADDITKADIGKYFTPKDLARYYNEILAQRGKGGKMFFPFRLLNNTTLGLREGQFVIVASRPSVGKTSFLENVAFFNAEKGFKVLFASAEMDTESLLTRILTRLSRVNLWKETPKEGQELVQYSEALKRLGDSSFFLYDKGLMSTEDLEEQIKKEKFDMVCIDYLSLVDPRKPHRSIYEKVTYASQELKMIAVEYKVAMVVASQYNRLADKSQPTLADLRDSGGIEQDADIVISLFVDKEDKLSADDSSLTKVKVDILKNRNGYTVGNSENKEYFLWFKKELTEFYDPEIYEKEQDKKLEEEIPF